VVGFWKGELRRDCADSSGPVAEGLIQTTTPTVSNRYFTSTLSTCCSRLCTRFPSPPLPRPELIPRLSSQAYSAVETRNVDRRRLAFAVIGRIVSGGLSDVIQHLLRENDGVLQLLFNSMIEEHVMVSSSASQRCIMLLNPSQAARARIDIASQHRPAVSRIFRHVARMSSTSSWGGLLRDTIDGANSLFTIIVQIGVLRALTTRENRSYLALSSLGFLGTLRWIFRSRSFALSTQRSSASG
jgi:hypothetical protein